MVITPKTSATNDPPICMKKCSRAESHWPLSIKWRFSPKTAVRVEKAPKKPVITKRRTAGEISGRVESQANAKPIKYAAQRLDRSVPKGEAKNQEVLLKAYVRPQRSMAPSVAPVATLITTSQSGPSFVMIVSKKFAKIVRQEAWALLSWCLNFFKGQKSWPFL